MFNLTRYVKAFSPMIARHIFIRSFPTPNPMCIKFIPGKDVAGSYGSKEYNNIEEAKDAPLAEKLFDIEGVTKVFYGPDFISITKSENSNWDELKSEILTVITEFYLVNNSPLLLRPERKTDRTTSTKLSEDDLEVLNMIKDLIKTRVRPSLLDDGGDLEFRGFDFEQGVLYK